MLYHGNDPLRSKFWQLPNGYWRAVNYMGKQTTCRLQVEAQRFAARPDPRQVDMFPNKANVDMMRKPCKKHRGGTFMETSQMDDAQGELHCTKGGETVKRWQTVETAKKFTNAPLKEVQRFASKGKQLNEATKFHDAYEERIRAGWSPQEAAKWAVAQLSPEEVRKYADSVKEQGISFPGSAPGTIPADYPGRKQKVAATRKKLDKEKKSVTEADDAASWRKKLKDVLPDTDKLEIYVNKSWTKVDPLVFRSFTGSRQRNGQPYKGPCYVWLTNNRLLGRRHASAGPPNPGGAGAPKVPGPEESVNEAVKYRPGQEVWTVRGQGTIVKALPDGHYKVKLHTGGFVIDSGDEIEAQSFRPNEAAPSANLKKMPPTKGALKKGMKPSQALKALPSRMSKAAQSADTDQSDREYIKQLQSKSGIKEAKETTLQAVRSRREAEEMAAHAKQMSSVKDAYVKELPNGQFQPVMVMKEAVDPYSKRLVGGIRVKTKRELNYSKSDQPGTVPAGTMIELKFSEKNPMFAYFEHNGVWRTLFLNSGANSVSGITKSPSQSTLERMMNDGIATSVTGKLVEPDGYGPDGSPSWLLALGLI
jgi:hypothetical protein